MSLKHSTRVSPVFAQYLEERIMRGELTTYALLEAPIASA